MSDQWNYEQAFLRHDGLITAEQQQRLRKSHVAIVGMGGVGGIHLVTLGRLGIGKFTIADLDEFEIANVNRQYGAKCDTFGKKKAEVMAEEIRQINPEVELQVFDKGVTRENVADFLDGADLLVDGIDFFEIDLRRYIFRQAAENGIFAVTAAPLGFSSAWLIFDPNGMSFDDYFDLNDGQSELEQMAAFAVGLAPGALHSSYFDLTKISCQHRRGPSVGAACQLCAGVAAAEALKILLDQGTVRCAPCYSQFDAYHGQMFTAELPLGNREPEQLAARAATERRLAIEPNQSPSWDERLRQLLNRDAADNVDAMDVVHV